jgi:catechol 2,3-dioxygenase-like lactoylglutathione lyase family enzyme
MVNPKRADVTAIHSIDRFVFSVPDLDEAERYYRAFGLDVRRREGKLDIYTFGNPHCWGTLHATGQPKKLEYLRLGVYAEDYDALRRQLGAKGVAEAAPHPMGERDSGGVWLTDPDGTAVQVIVAERCTPDEKAPANGSLFKPNPINVPIGPARSESVAVRPLRFSHMLMFVSDVARSLAFYEDVLGFRLSDKSADLIAFTHGAHSSDHHLLALAKSDGPGLHHVSWVVGSIDEVGLGMEQMTAAGYPHGWGVGRHVIGSNYFFYSRDPWGSYSEFSYDIGYIDAATDWPAADYPPEDSIYLWGPALPDDFIVNHQVQSAAVPQAEGTVA